MSIDLISDDELLAELEDRGLVCCLTIDAPESLTAEEIATAIFTILDREQLFAYCPHGHFHIALVHPKGYANDSAQKIVH